MSWQTGDQGADHDRTAVVVPDGCRDWPRSPHRCISSPSGGLGGCRSRVYRRPELGPGAVRLRPGRLDHHHRPHENTLFWAGQFQPFHSRRLVRGSLTGQRSARGRWADSAR